MADRRRSESKEIKKDQQVRREVLREIGSEISQITLTRATAIRTATSSATTGTALAGARTNSGAATPNAMVTKGCAFLMNKPSCFRRL
jgi:hypothetical protein